MESGSDTSVLLCGERAAPSRVAPDPVLLADDRVLRNLLELEPLYLPDVDYFEHVQTDIKPFMRKVVATWMLEVCEEQRCEEQLFPLAVNFLDRFLCNCVITRSQLQLSGAACLLIASKIRQSRAFSVRLLCLYTDNSITETDLKRWELLVLTKLKWNVVAVTGQDMVCHILERCPWARAHPLVRSHAITLVALSYTEPEFMRVAPSVIGGGSIVAAVEGLRAGESCAVAQAVASLIGSDPSTLRAAATAIETAIAQHNPY